MRVGIAVLAALLATLGAATAAEYPIKGEVTGTFEVHVEADPGTQVDTNEYAVVVGSKYVYLIMVEEDDLQDSGKFKTQPFLVPVPADKVEVNGSLVKFPDGLDDTFAAYCLNPMGRHPRGEMVVPKWNEIEDRFVEIKVVAGHGQVRTEERHLAPEWIKAVCKRVEGVVDPGEWKRDAQTIIWVTEAAVPENVQVNVENRVQIDVNATVQVNAQDFFQINESELRELANAGDEMARQLLEFFSNKEELENLVNTAQSALDFVKQHLSDIVTTAQTAKEAYETAKSVFGKIPVSPAVIIVALAALAIFRRRP
ncbi:hypothetical protein [Methanopyrus kandleri]|uniref:Uncharacterized secreted protein specific for M.kandleri, MK-6 family n=1 Tax=Methanopyrus kandleri (strain AV19 / DSM 6324 / JCM 9639 / NBRC 100938) TaxID=190192 RepID=Q8TW68_METKA|nr:hypothetical protein [Methanopyrus kandleri]AAM02381.1 Uncharacterized secreted protein specific for M.kandleri, MK-6 family [Methanopyrus kandleri AV19]